MVDGFIATQIRNRSSAMPSFRKFSRAEETCEEFLELMISLPPPCPSFLATAKPIPEAEAVTIHTLSWNLFKLYMILYYSIKLKKT